MTRHKDVDWSLPPASAGGTSTYDTITVALLMDIRDELKTVRDELRSLNSLMHCSNTVQIPHTLKRIDRRLATKLPLKAK